MKVPGARFASWDSSAGNICLMYDSCEDINTSEKGSISSAVECGRCRVRGVCQGPLVDRKVVHQEMKCVELCEDNQSCAYYSYLGKPMVCLLFERCEVMHNSPNTFTASKGCMSLSDQEQLLHLHHPEDSASHQHLTLVSLVEPNTTCQIPFISHENEVKYLGYIESLNVLVVCISECFAFDGLRWNKIPDRLIDTGGGSGSDVNVTSDFYQSVPQGLLNVRGRGQRYEQLRIPQEWTTAIFNGREWINIEIENVKENIAPFMFNSSYPMLFAFPGDYWSLDYEGRTWIQVEGPLEWLGQDIDREGLPDRFLHKFKGAGVIGVYYNANVVMESTSLKGIWTPIEGVFLRHNMRYNSLVTLVPNSFLIHCLEN